MMWLLSSEAPTGLPDCPARASNKVDRGQVVRSIKAGLIVLTALGVLDLAIALVLGIPDLLPNAVVFLIRVVTSQLKPLPIPVVMGVMFVLSLVILGLPFHLARLIIGGADVRAEVTTPPAEIPGSIGAGFGARKRSTSGSPVSHLQRLATVRLIRQIR